MRKKKEPPCFNIITTASWNQMGYCCGVGEMGNFKSAESARIEQGSMTYNSTLGRYEQGPNVTMPPATLAQAKRVLRRIDCKTILATTVPYQSDAVQALRAVGFKKVADTPSREDSRRTISVWMYTVPKRRKRNGK